jgi:hypothetical protein
MATIQQIKTNANTFIRSQVAVDSIDQDDVADRTDDVADELLVRGIAGVANTAAMSALSGTNFKRAIVKANGVFEWLAGGTVDGVDVFSASGGGVWSRILTDGGTAGGTIIGGLNGVAPYSLDPLQIALGQDVGETGAPAALLDDREIPYGNNEIILQGVDPAAAIRMGAVAGGRVTLKITGANGAVATYWTTNINAVTYKDFQWEHTTANNGSLVLNDNTGNLWILNRLASSCSAPFHTHQNITDFAASIFLGITRPRHVLTNRGAAGPITLTLGTPTALQKPEFTFTQVNDFPLTIQSDGGAHPIRVGRLVSLAGTGTIRGGGIGSSIRLQWMVTAGEWQAIALVGNWVVV